MSVFIRFKCGGCPAEADGTTWLARHTEVLHNTPDGQYVRYSIPDVQTVAPEGWIAHDPWTGCCYCPTCWAWLLSDDPNKHQLAAAEANTP